MGYRCTVSPEGYEFFKGNDTLVASSLEVFELAQSFEFKGDRSVSAFPAEIGLMLRASPQKSTLAFIAKPDGAYPWQEIDESQSWLDGGEKLYFLDPEEIREVRNLVARFKIDLGEVTYQAGVRVASELSSSLHVELEVEEGSEFLPVKGFGTEIHNHRISVKLHSYQEWSVERMSALCASGLGVVLADEMGLGKTVQSIAVMTNVVNSGGSVLAVVPPVLIPNWVREIRKFAPSLTVGVMHRASGAHIHPNQYGDFDVLITAYSTLASTKGDLQLLNSKTWDLVVLDEAQFIKNPDAKRSAAAKHLNRKASIALSGTPVENSPLDIWAISEFIFPSLLGARTEFETKQEVSEEALDKVTRLLRPLMIRRTLDDVADENGLPERIDETEYFQLPFEKSELQKQILSEKRNSQSKFNSLLMLAAEAHESDDLYSLRSSPKLERLQMIIQSAFESGEKVIVFCRYRRTIDNIRAALRSALPDTFIQVIRGDSGSPEDRQDIVDQFSALDRGILLLNPQAAGYGLNITAANHVVHYHPLWNPAQTDQATKRAHRPGQRRLTRVHHLLYESSVEEVVFERSERKRDLAKILVGEEFDAGQMADLNEIMERMKGFRQ